MLCKVMSCEEEEEEKEEPDGGSGGVEARLNRFTREEEEEEEEVCAPTAVCVMGSSWCSRRCGSTEDDTVERFATAGGF